MRRSATALLLLLGVFSLTFDVRADPPSFAVEIAPGLSPRKAPNDVAQIILSRLAEPQIVVPGEEGKPQLVPPAPRIVKMECVPGDPWKTSREDNPEQRIGPDVVWVVHAKGSFVSHRGPGRSIVRDYGFYVVNDETGEVIAVGSLSSMNPEEE